MADSDAERFVDRMRGDQGFRREIINARDEESLRQALQEAGFSFDQLELVKAMAGCMEGMEAEQIG